MILNKIYRLLMLIAAMVALGAPGLHADDKVLDSRKCRNLIIEGNRLFKEERWSEAEVKYQKALQADPTSQVAQFNLASALLRQGRISDLKDPNSSISRARATFSSLSADPKNSTVLPELIQKSFYNLGNLAYEEENYQLAVENYKGALRINPGDNLARENLRLAQLKLQQQQNDKNKDQDKKDQDKKKEEEKKDQQQKQDQNKQDQQQNPQNQKQQPQQPQGGINDENAAQILKTMENEEAATRRRIQLQQGKQGNPAGTRVTGNPW